MYPAHLSVTDTRSSYGPPPMPVGGLELPGALSFDKVVPIRSSVPLPPDPVTLEERAQAVLTKLRNCHALLNDLISGPTASQSDCEPELVGVTTKLEAADRQALDLVNRVQYLVNQVGTL